MANRASHRVKSRGLGALFAVIGAIMFAASMLNALLNQQTPRSAIETAKY